MKTADGNEFEIYRSEAEQKWGGTAAYAEYSAKTRDYSEEKFGDISAGMEKIFGRFAGCPENGSAPDSPEAQELVSELQKYITENLYTCTDEILAGLGRMYTSDERFRRNIDRHGEGTAGFISRAIEAKVGYGH